METEPQLFQCTEPGCDKSFPKKSQMHGHKSRAHVLRPFLCTFAKCNKKFATANFLQTHIEQKHQDAAPAPSIFFCDYDGCVMCEGGDFAGFITQEGLTIHRGRRHRLWICATCSKIFPKDISLKNHCSTEHGTLLPSKSSNEELDLIESDAAAASSSQNARQGLGIEEPELELGAEGYVSIFAGCGSTYGTQPGLRNNIEVRHVNEASPSSNLVNHVISNDNFEGDSDGHISDTNNLSNIHAQFAGPCKGAHISSAKKGRQAALEISDISDDSEMSEDPNDPDVRRVSLQNKQVTALQPQTPAAHGVHASAGKTSGNTGKTSMGIRCLANTIILNSAHQDPKPIRRVLPTEDDIRLSDEGELFLDSESGSEFSDDPDAENDSDNEHFRNKYTRNKQPVHPDESEDGMSDGFSTPLTKAKTKNRKAATLPPRSKAKIKANEENNPFFEMPSLQAATGASFRNDVMFNLASAERQAEIDGFRARGQITEDIDFDLGLAFPRPSAKETVLTKTFKDQTASLIHARVTHPKEIRMSFPYVDGVPGLNFPDEIFKAPPPLADVTIVADGTARDSTGRVRGRISRGGKVRRFGSRSKLGPLKTKRDYNWKDPIKNQKKKDAQAARRAAAIEAHLDIIPVMDRHKKGVKGPTPGY